MTNYNYLEIVHGETKRTQLLGYKGDDRRITLTIIRWVTKSYMVAKYGKAQSTATFGNPESMVGNLCKEVINGNLASSFNCN